MMLFPDAEAALKASLSLVAESAAHQLPEVRVGVATGQVVPRDGDIFGHTVNLAARIASVAAPSQVLVCGGTHDAATDESSEMDFEALEPVSLRASPIPCRCFRSRPGYRTGFLEYCLAGHQRQDQEDHEDDKRDTEENARDRRRRRGNSGKAEEARNQRNHEKDKSPFQHGGVPSS
jgi:hypothetical protein